MANRILIIELIYLLSVTCTVFTIRTVSQGSTKLNILKVEKDLVYFSLNCIFGTNSKRPENDLDDNYMLDKTALHFLYHFNCTSDLPKFTL